MNNITRKAVECFFRTPGYCSHEELLMAKEFLENLKEMLSDYISIVGSIPQGLTLDSNLDSVAWYINFVLTKEVGK